MSEPREDRPFVVPTLRGIILRDDHDQVVVQATPDDVRRFAARPGQEVAVRPEAPARRRTPQSSTMYLYGSFPSVRAWPAFTPEVDDDESDGPEAPGTLRRDAVLYDEHGYPVARILGVDVRTPTYTMGRVSSTSNEVIVAGPVEYEIRARGLPGVTLLG